MITANFQSVRPERSWTAALPRMPRESALARFVRRKTALRSRMIFVESLAVDERADLEGIPGRAEAFLVMDGLRVVGLLSLFVPNRGGKPR